MPADIQSKHFTIQALAEGVYAAVHTPGGQAISNAGIIDLGGRTIVFDTMMTPAAASDLRAAAVALTGREPDVIINSHYHNDHIWGNQAFAPESIILSSTATRKLIETKGAAEIDDYTASAPGRLAALRAEVASGSPSPGAVFLLPYWEGISDALAVLRPRLPEQVVEGGTLQGDRRSAEMLVFKYAHTDSDMALYLPDDGIVFMSDLLFIDTHPYIGDGDPLGLPDALRAVLRLDATVFVPGHGPVGGREDVATMIAYVESCLDVARKILRSKGLSDDAFNAAAIPPLYQSWDLPVFYPANLRAAAERVAVFC